MSANTYAIKAPIPGTFHEAMSPGEPPIVAVGQKVVKGEVVCILEAMKMFTELKTDVTGTVKEILVEDGDHVAKNQELIIIEND